MAGRKVRYDTYVKPHLEDISEWIKTKTEKQIAEDLLGIGESTWHLYKNQHPELEAAVIKGRQNLVSEVKGALIQRALGFEYSEEKQYIKDGERGITSYTEITKKRALPDVAACNSILQNLDTDWYRDRAQVRLREQELELKQKIANANNWFDDEEGATN